MPFCKKANIEILKAGPLRPRTPALSPAKCWQSLWEASWGRTPGGLSQLCTPLDGGRGLADVPPPRAGPQGALLMPHWAGLVQKGRGSLVSQDWESNTMCQLFGPQFSHV